MEKIKNKNGFTLVEIIIVVAIIAMLSAMFLPSLFNAPSEARDKKRVSDLNRIKSVIIENTLVGIMPPNNLDFDGYVDECIDPEVEDKFADYLPEFGGVIPSDPWPNEIAYETPGYIELIDAACEGTYGYRTDPTYDGTYRFVLFARLENYEYANVKCADVWGEMAPEFTENFDEETDLPCYMLYVQ